MNCHFNWNDKTELWEFDVKKDVDFESFEFDYEYKEPADNDDIPYSSYLSVINGLNR